MADQHEIGCCERGQVCEWHAAAAYTRSRARERRAGHASPNPDDVVHLREFTHAAHVPEDSRRRGRWCVPAFAAIVALACALTVQSGPARSDVVDRAAPFRGTGAWVSLFTNEWSDPVAAAQAFASHGVSTLYLETGRSNSPGAIAKPAETGAFLDAAHAAGLDVVAWYYPTLRRPDLDVARLLATARFESPSGGTFDGVGIDIEDETVKIITRRNTRLLSLMRRVRAAAPAMPIGAITYPPVALDLNTKVWPTFPWVQVARLSDAILPMAYWRYDTHAPVGAAWYTAGNLVALRFLTGRPDLVVHIVGLVPASTAEVAAFAHEAGANGRRASACTRRSPSRATSGPCSPPRPSTLPGVLLGRAAPRRALAARSASALLVAAGCGGGRRDAASVPGPPIVTRPIGVGPAFRLPPRGAAATRAAPIGDLRCRPGACPGPIVAHLEIFARRETLVIPAGIGVVGARCRYPVRTLMPTGLIVAERRRPDARRSLRGLGPAARRTRRLAGFSGPIVAFVAGRRVRGDVRRIPIRHHSQIVVEVSGYVPPHAHYVFPLSS